MPTSYNNLGNKTGGGDPNILKLKDGTNKIRPLDNVVAEWKQHGIQHPSDDEQFAAMVCPGPRSCPLCRKPVDNEGNQHFPMSRRFASNVWDYESNSVKILVGGPRIFDEFKAQAQVGIMPDSCDWTIVKEGAGRNTKYTMIRHDVSQSGNPSVTPDQLHDVGKYEQPASVEKIFEVLDKFGIDYDALTIPSYTSEEALAFKMPYTKFKGMTVDQMLAQDQDFALWLHGTKLEQGQLGDPVFLALQAALEDRGLVDSIEDSLSLLPSPEPTPPAPAPPATATAPASVVIAPTGAPASEQLSPSSASLVKLIGPDGEVAVPPSVVDSMLAAGFKHPVEVPDDAPLTMRVAIGGQPVELPTEQAQGLLQSGVAQPIGIEAPEPEEPPALPAPDEPVNVSIGGTVVPMPYLQAGPLVDGGTGTFVDEAVTQAHEAAKADPTQATPSSGTPSSEASASAQPGTPAQPAESDGDPEKPFGCAQCTAAYKTKGALTNHVNRVHGAATEAQPTAVPAATNGTADQTLSERVKQKVAHSPFATDFNRMLSIFEEETGVRNFGEMNDEQLTKLEARIDKEMVASNG